MKIYKSISALSFEIDDFIYLYDRYSNEILLINKCIQSILDDYFVLPRNELMDKYSAEFSQSDIINSISEIEEVIEKYAILRPFSIPKLSISHGLSTKEKVSQKLNDSVLQIVFGTTESCNLRCKYCIYSGAYTNSSRTHGVKSISWEKAQRAIDLFLATCHSTTNDSKHISFYGGEATLNFDVVKKCVEYTQLRNRTIGFTLNTNLTLLTDSMLDYFIDNNFNLSISIDGPAKINDRFRVSSANKPTHNIVESNLWKIRHKNEAYFKKKILFNIVISPHDYDLNSLDEYFSGELFEGIPLKSLKTILLNAEDNEFFDQHNYRSFVSKWRVHAISNFVNAHIDGVVDYSKIPISYSFYIDSMKRIHFRDMNRFSLFPFFWPNGACIPGLRSLYISSDGIYYPCEGLYDHNSFDMGVVEEGINHEKIANLIDDYCNETIQYCKDCWAYRLCGECYTSSLQNGKYSHDKKKAACSKIKSNIFDNLKNYMTILSKNPNAFDYLKKEEAPLILSFMSIENE